VGVFGSGAGASGGGVGSAAGGVTGSIGGACVSAGGVEGSSGISFTYIGSGSRVQKSSESFYRFAYLYKKL